MNRRRFLKSAGVSAATGGLFFGCKKTETGGDGGGGEGGTPGKIKIVSSLPRTGSAQGQTDTIVRGIQMAIEEEKANLEKINLSIEYSDLDDATAAQGQWDAGKEADNARAVSGDADVVAFIGPYNSGAAKVSMPILNDAELLQVSPACTWPGLTKVVPGDKSGEPMIYRPNKTLKTKKKISFCRVCPTDFVQGPLSAVFAKGNLGVKRVYILDDKELYGAGIAGLFKKECEKLGIEVAGHQSIVTTATDFRTLMSQVQATKPDLVYFGGTTQSKGGQLAKDMKTVGISCPMMVPDGCYEQAFIDSAGPEAVNGRVYATIGGFDPSELTGRGAEFVKRYKEKYSKDPEAYAVYGYEAAKVVLEAIKTVGKKDRLAILDATLNTANFEKGALDKWGFDEDGDTTLKALTISLIKDGKFVPQKTIREG